MMNCAALVYINPNCPILIPLEVKGKSPFGVCVFVLMSHSVGRLGLRKGSLSAPLTTLVFLCLDSLGVGLWEEGVLGGLRFARSFRCLSISSLCWFIHSCCLLTEKNTCKCRIKRMHPIIIYNGSD